MRLKQIYYTVILAAMSVAASNAMAGNVTVHAARNIANQYMKQHGTLGLRSPAMADLQLVHAEASHSITDAYDYYAFNVKGGGFIIIAGEDRATQVLGYSDNGYLDFDHLPCNLQGLLNCYKQEIEFLQTYQGNDLVPVVHAINSRGGVEPLIQTTWGQGAPYDWQCPMYDGEYCVVGCVATAMAQVMKYWQYPEGCAGLASYRTGTLNLTVPALPATTFDYSLMLDSYCHRDPITQQLVQDAYTDAQAQEVAKLSRYCGQAVYMDYTPSASGASVSHMEDAMTAFGFDSVQYKYRYQGWWVFYDSLVYIKQWEDLLRTELDAGRPILYSARDNSAGIGHAFVCDGYNMEGKFHFNFGWYARSNGWYVSTALEVSPREGVERHYNNNHEIVYGLRPPEGWLPPTAILKGDVNSDGKVNITDVTVLIDYLLGGGTINLAAADVNNNATVTIADLTALLDLLLTTP